MPVLLDAQPLADADVEDLARGDVARHEVAVGRVALFEEIISLAFGNLLRRAGVLRLARHPNPPPFAADALADQPQLVGAGNGRGMDLDELGIGVDGPGLEAAARRRCRCRPSSWSSGRRSAPQPPLATITASAGKARISMVTMSWATQPRHRPCVVEDRPQEVPELVLRHLAGHFPAADLLVQGVEQLLAGGGAGEGRAADRACRRSGAGRGSLRGVRLKVTPSRSIRSMIRGAQSAISLTGG